MLPFSVLRTLQPVRVGDPERQCRFVRDEPRQSRLQRIRRAQVPQLIRKRNLGVAGSKLTCWLSSVNFSFGKPCCCCCCDVRSLDYQLTLKRFCLDFDRLS